MPMLFAVGAAIVSGVGGAVGAVAGALGAVTGAISAGVGAVAGGLASALGASGVTALTVGHFASVATSTLLFGNGLVAGAMAWSAVSQLASFVMPKPKTSGGLVGEASGSPSPIAFKADPNAGIPYVMGRSGVGGNILFAQTDGDKNRFLDYIVAHSLGPIDSYESFSVNAAVVPFAGHNATGTYAGKMYMDWRLGARPDTALNLTASVPGASLPDWTSDHKLSRIAAAQWMLDYDQDKYPSGTPSSPIWVIKGVKVYDPRLDSTYPGGSGPQRADNEATWTWSANPGLHALTFCLGRFENGIKICGLGAPLRLLDVPAFVEVANVCDANGWTLGGQVLSTDPKANVLTAILAAASAVFMPLGAKISCMVDTPRVAIATIDQSDIIGPASVAATQSRRTRINRVVPGYRSESHGWQYVSAGPVQVDDYVAEDGGYTRTRQVQFDLVQDARQAAQLGAYVVVNGREFGPINMPLKPRHMGLKLGDAVTVNAPELGLNDQLCLITGRAFDPGAMTVALTLRSETTAKHDFALGRTASPPPTPGLTGIDLTVVPAPGASAWAVTGATLSSNGGQIPAIVITGACDNPNADQIVFEYAVNGTGVWNLFANAARNTTRVEITGLAPGVAYQAAVSYVVRGVPSARRVLGPVGAGGVLSPTNLAVSNSHIQDGAVSNGKIGNFQVDTAKVAINAITHGVWVQDDGVVNLNTTFQTVWSAAATTQAGRMTFHAYIWVSNTGDAMPLDIVLTKDGATIDSSTLLIYDHHQDGGTVLMRDPSPDSAIHVYAIQLRNAVGSFGQKISVRCSMEEVLR